MIDRATTGADSPGRPGTCTVCGAASYDPIAVVQSFPADDLAPTALFVRCDDCELLYADPWPVEGEDRAGPARAPQPGREEALALALDLGAVVLGPGGEPLPGEAGVAAGGETATTTVLVGALEVDPDPIGLLSGIRERMSPTDSLVLVTGNADSLLMRVFGGRHGSPYHFPVHARVFGRKGLERLAEAAGLRIAEISTKASAGAWTTSVQNFLVDWGLPTSVRILADGAVARWIRARVEKRAARSGRGALLVARLVPSAPAERPRSKGDAPSVVGSARAPVAILGAGVAGLTAARVLRHHGVPVVVFEAGEQIAGLARSFRDEDGFSNDFGAHFITNRFAAALGVGARCRTVHRFGEAVRLGDRTYGYPFGLMRSPRFALSAVRSRFTSGSGSHSSVAELYREQFGSRLAEEVAFPLVEAWAGTSPDELAPTVSPPQLDRGMSHVVKLKLASRWSDRAVANGFSRAQPENPHVYHVYPVDGLGVLTDRLAEGLDDAIELRSRVEAIYADDSGVRGVRVAGADRDASAVVSTAPVHVLPRLVRGTDALQPLSRFRYRAFTMVNLRFDVRPVLSEVCTWIPDRRFTFFRLTEAPLAMPWLAPEGKSIVTADIGCEVGDDIWTMDEEALAERCLDEIEELFPGVRKHRLGASVIRTPVAHPVYKREYEAERIEFARGLPVERLYSVGRNGEFAHVLMEDVYWRTRQRVLAEILAP